MTNTFVIAILSLILLLPIASQIRDPLPFGKDRLNDFFFIHNGTIFHQFVMMNFPYSLVLSLIVSRIMVPMAVHLE